eukprot:3356544-Amphidinium_carterae.1
MAATSGTSGSRHLDLQLEWMRAHASMVHIPKTTCPSIASPVTTTLKQGGVMAQGNDEGRSHQLSQQRK